MGQHTQFSANDMHPVPFRSTVEGPVGVEIPAELLRMAMRVYAMREARTSYFEPILFGEAAWDILLALYIAFGRGYSMKVSDACAEARVPATTGLRWLEHLVTTGMVIRKKNYMDARSSIVEISAEATSQLNRYLQRAVAIQSRA